MCDGICPCVYGIHTCVFVYDSICMCVCDIYMYVYGIYTCVCGEAIYYVCVVYVHVCVYVQVEARNFIIFYYALSLNLQLID